MNYRLNYLKELESESIFILREIAAQFDNPILLFSGGKDSILVSYLAKKAFFPARIPFPFLHVDTGHNFEETIEYRDEWIEEIGAKLIVGSVQECIDNGELIEETGLNASRNYLQTHVLLKALEEGKYDAAIGGARRDEEKARAKERFSATVMNLDNGIQKISAQSFGIYLMVASIWVSILEYFQLVIGLKWMYGSIFC